MNKRKRVPAALHAEIHEYSALIRALRTRDTLDLTSQLIRANAASSQAATDDGLLDDDDLALDVDEQRPDASSNAALPSGSSMEAAPLKRKRKRKAAPKKVRDHWTRWPLMPSDVHVPEWSLEDEVRVLAVHHVKSTLNAAAPAREEATLLEDMDDDFANTLLPPSSVDALSDEATSYLSRILALVATLRPPAAESMQNRFAPFNWEAVMAAVSSGGIADTKILQNVQRRMEAIYGPAKSHATHRTQVHASRGAETRSIVERHELSFLDLAYRPPPLPKL
ncbi:hypothetical protein C8Q72DRAFT_794189 [Fomitopsis betulina]|nr:hypothetical protein C8Q72DRAFT_794189 [Fomitopsis betulina]